MSNILKTLAAGSASEPTDEYFNQTTLLLHGDGTNGAQNNTFLDSSSNTFTITRNGNTTQGTFSPFSVAEGEWSNYFDGTGDYLSLASNADLTPASGDFCVECWIYPIAFGTYNGIFVGNAVGGFFFGKLTGGIGLRISATSDVISATAPSTNQWTHVAITRSGTDVRLFYDGVQQGSTVTNSTNFVQSATYIGTDGSGGSYWNGYISGLRFVKGSAVYTSNFTPSTTPLTAITNTELLTCQSNRFVDNSSNAFAITVNGNTSVQPYSPFAPSAAYDPSVNGGSGYFDGSGDMLTATGSVLDPSATDYTIEFWLYPKDVTTLAVLTEIGANTTSALQIVMSSGGINFGRNNVAKTSAPIVANQWSYVACVKSGSTYYVYVNGSRTTSDTGSVDSNTTAYIFARTGPTYSLNGYACNYQISNTARYTDTTMSVPTALKVSDGNTQLLLNFSNAGIYDSCSKNDLETVGNAQVDTSVVKYGTGSMKFDGTGDYLKGRVTSFIDFGSGNFTIECWVNLSANNQFNPIVLLGRDTQSGLYCDISSSNNARIVAYIGGAWGVVATGSTALSTSTFYHLAFVRNGSSFKIYVDGTEDASATNSGTISNPTSDASASFQVAYLQTSAAVDRYFNGYIDDLRITKGVARYTANFTVPDKAFPDQ